MKNSLVGILKTLIGNLCFFVPFKKRIGYIGWIGHGNLGDEAMYFAIKKMFPKFNIIPFKATNKTLIFENIIKNRVFDAVFLGGGTLINAKGELNDMKIACEKYSPLFILGAGVKSPDFWSKINPAENCLNDWMPLLKKADLVGIRGPLSKQILANNGFHNAEIVGDPALFLARENVKKKKKNKKLCINIGYTNNKAWGKDEEVLKNIVDFTESIIDEGWSVVFLPVSKIDVPYIEEAIKKIRRKTTMFREYHSIKKTMDLIEDCDLFVGEKLHSVILAMCTYTPSIMIEYRPKCLDFMLSMGMEDFNVKMDNISKDILLNMIEILYSDLELFQTRIHKKITYYKKIQTENSLKITRLIMANKLYNKSYKYQ